MDHHNAHNPPLHWGYSSTPTTTSQNTWTPPSTRGVKRAISESDCDDVYSEESSKEQTSPGGSDSCQLLSRKKRRGVIEKKRRDRINSSLSELKRLVPTAYEKQGSAKLEKAEILQLTVDHLKTLHAKGADGMGFDPQRFAMDYHIIGFRECASEVARYLVSIEGMDIQDPLRLRLMSHLQCFVAQRELSKTNASPNWVHSSSYQTNYHSPATATATSSVPYHQNYPTQSTSNSYIPQIATLTPLHHQQHSQQHLISATPTTPNTANSPTYSTEHQQQQQQQQQQHRHYASHETQHQEQHQQPHQDQQQGPTYTDLTSSVHANDAVGRSGLSLSLGYDNPQYPTNAAQVAYGQAGSTNYNANNSKQPYRPWGAEMAY